MMAYGSSFRHRSMVFRRLAPHLNCLESDTNLEEILETSAQIASGTGQREALKLGALRKECVVSSDTSRGGVGDGYARSSFSPRSRTSWILRRIMCWMSLSSSFSLDAFCRRESAGQHEVMSSQTQHPAFNIKQHLRTDLLVGSAYSRLRR